MISRIITTISKPILLCLLLLLTLSSHLIAQEKGKIIGKVVDSKSGETLIGVNVVIQSTTKGTATDIDGNYTLANLEPDTYAVVFSYVSYTKKIVEGVEVKPGEVTKIDVTLSPDTEQLGEIVVSARSVMDNEAALLAKRQKSVAFSNAISTETISQTGAGNAAAALSNISGASVEDGKYAVIRGLGGRYSNAQLNGANMPSAAPDRNAAQMDLFPTDLIDNVEVKKTFTPDQPGSFSGGNINISTKNFPDDFIFNITTGASINSKSSFENDFLSGPTSNTDWLGYDNGLRDVPDIIADPDVEIPRSQFARRDSELAGQLDNISKSFSNQMVPSRDQRNAGFNNDFSFTLGNQLEFLGKPLGFVLSGTYSRDFEFYDDGVNNQFVATAADADGLTNDFSFNDTKGTETANLGGMANMNYKLSNNHQVGFNFLRNQVGTNQGRYQVGNFPKNIPSDNVFFETYTLRYTERNVTSYQVKGKHFFPKLNKAKVEWNVSLANATQDEPDFRIFFNDFVDVERPDTTFRVFNINLGSSNATPPTRLFREMDEDNNQFGMDIDIPFDVGLSSDIKFKTGFSFEDKDRTFRERKFDYNLNGSSFRDSNGDIEAFFSDENVGVTDTTASGTFRFGNVIRDGSIAQNNYNGDQEVLAFYGMINIPITERLKFVGGARFESTDIEIVSQDSTREPGIIDIDDVLPSANFIYSITDRMNARFTASQTLARPTFREFAPFQAINFAGGRQLSGNTELTRTLIQNYDLRWEWFTRPGEVVAVSGFFKNFDDPIERVIVSNNDQETFQNVPTATVKGIELEFRKRLDLISDAFKNFVVGTNIAVIDSDVDVPERELEFAEGFDIDDTRPLQGQSDFLVNSVLSYQNPKSGTVFSISHNRFGERLVNVGLGGTPNIFEQGRNEVFVMVKQNFFQTLSAKFSISNLLNAPIETAQTFKGQEFVDSRIEIGRTFKFSVSYSL